MEEECMHDDIDDAEFSINDREISTCDKHTSYLYKKFRCLDCGKIVYEEYCYEGMVEVVE